MAGNQTEDMLIQSLREKAATAKPVPVGPVQKVSKEEALQQAKIILKKTLMDNKPQSPEQAQAIINDAFMIVYAYFHKIGLEIKPQELMEFLFKGVQNGK